MKLHHGDRLTGYLDRRELFTWLHGKKKIIITEVRRLDLPPRPEVETKALTCVSMMRRFDLRDSAPPTLLWQGSDNGLK